MELLEGLNEAQREAVTLTEGIIRVIAGAGSGKTRALSHRFAYLVNELGILPGHILCVTFTNKSANEMRRRIHNLTGDNDTGYINTFHGFCVSVLGEESYAVQYPKSFLVLDNADIDAMLAAIYEERGLTLRNKTFGQARDMIEMRKCIQEPEYYRDMIAMSVDMLKDKYLRATETDDIIFYGYLYQEKKCFALDYNDLIKFTLYIFEENEEIRRKWQKRLEYIMIDEFQDIDALQYKLMEVLCDYHKNLFIVGDPDQTIYTWRGANVRYLLDFDRAFPNVRTVFLKENYRSTPQILAVADSLIEKNRDRIPKKLIPIRPSGAPVVCHHAANAGAEADWIAESIKALTAEGISLREITVLYRAHYLTRNLEEAFLRDKLPYAIYSGVPFFERMEIKDALAYLRLIAFRDDLSFARVVNSPKRNIGKSRMRFLQEYADAHRCSLYTALTENLENEDFKRTKAKDFVDLIDCFAGSYANRQISEVLTELLDKSGYEKMLRTEGSQERLDNLAELKQSVYDYETTCGEECTLEQYLMHVALFTNADAEDPGDKIKLMTVHAAKGLEFKNVFLCAMNEGVFPTGKTSTVQGMEEERRLAFVALTRAEDRLYLSEAEGRNFDGSPRYPSRFLLDIDPELLSFTAPPREDLIADARAYIALSAYRLRDGEAPAHFAPGTRVHHAAFGSGTILAADDAEEAYTVRFDRMDTPRTIAYRVKMHPEEA